MTSRIDSQPIDSAAQRIGVLFVNTPTQPPLGADTFIQLQIAGALDRRRHHVHVACDPGSSDRPTPTYTVVKAMHDVDIVPVNLGIEFLAGGRVTKLKGLLRAAPPAVGSMLRLVRAVRAHNISIIHTSDRARDALASVLLGRLTGAKCVINLHNGFGEWMPENLQRALHRADALIACSAFVGATFADAGYDRRSIHPVLNAIDPSKWMPGVGRHDVRQELGIGPDDPVILSVCRLYREKGVAELIRACAQLRSEFPRLRLVVVGVDPFPGVHYRAELEGLAAELGVSEVVEFLGHRDDVPHLMAAADIFAMPSHAEPFGLVYLEAMATEVPVIALDVAGAKEAVEHGLTGLLSPPGDDVALVTNIVALLGDPDLRRRMGRAGRNRVDRQFTPERMAADVADVYQRVLGGDR